MAATGYAVEFAGSTAVILPVTKQDFMFENDVTHESLAGSRHARIITKKSTKPKQTFTTKDIQKALTAITTEGIVIGSGKTYTAVNIYQVNLDINGMPAGSGHRKLSITNGAVFCKQLTAKSGEDAELEIEVHAISTDGITSPVTIGSGSLPAFPTAHERFSVGPMTLESIDIEELTSLTIDFGMKPDGILTGSAIAPTQLQVESVLPTIEFESHRVSLLLASTGIDPDGIAVTHANSIIWLRQRETNAAAYYDDTDTEHFKLTCDGFAIVDTGHTSDGNKLASIKGKVMLRNDGTNSPMIYQANQAIST